MSTVVKRRRTVSDADCRIADDFERVHDARVVRPSEVQGLSLVHSDSCELRDCLRRILLSSTGQSDRPWAIHGGAAQDDSGGHHAGRLLDFLGRLLERSAEVELCGGIRVDCGGGIYHLQRMVTLSGSIDMVPTSPC